MPIQVICPGCHKRFQVSEKFAGQKGPCPNCKAVIQIPSKSEEVVVHAPENFGPKDSSGTAVLKPIARTETKFNTRAAILIGTTVVVVLGSAVALRGYKGSNLILLLGSGAVLLGPVLAYAGYTFLRNEELEPHRGVPLMVRSLICGFIYAALWGLFALSVYYFNDNERFELFHMLFIAPVIAAIGGGVAFVTLDLDYGTGLIHFAFYLLVTIVLRLIMGLTPY